MQIPKEKGDAKAKEKIMVQTSHLGANRLARHFVYNVVGNPAQDEQVIPIIKKRKKRKKEFPHGTAIRCSWPSIKD